MRQRINKIEKVMVIDENGLVKDRNKEKENGFKSKKLDNMVMINKMRERFKD